MVLLTDDDIPGAKIQRELLEQCSVTQLKRWNTVELKVRGISKAVGTTRNAAIKMMWQ